MLDLQRRPAVTTGFSVVVWPRDVLRDAPWLDVLLWRFRFSMRIGQKRPAS